MKKTIINRNYSLLVLVLLILFITYINIPNNMTMTGGGAVLSSNPWDQLDPKDLDIKLMKHSKLYAILNNYFGIYIGVLVVLIGVTAYFGYTQYTYQGVPGAGVSPAVPWDSEGGIFLNSFFNLARTKYGLNSAGSVPTGIDPKQLATFEKQADTLVDQAKTAVDLFCNIVAPCNICECRGPDPNYGGKLSNAPLINYQGMNKLTKTSCKPVVSPPKSNVPGQASPGQAILDMHAKKGVSHKIIPRIPNCCCHLFSAYGIPTDEVTLTALSNSLIGPNGSGGTKDITSGTPSVVSVATKFPPSITKDTLKNSTFPLGLAKYAGCEPAGAPSGGIIPFVSPSGTIKPHTGAGAGSPGIYALNMFTACLSQTPIPVPTVSTNNGTSSSSSAVPTTAPFSGRTPLAKNILACRGYNVDLDRGISPHHAINSCKYSANVKASSYTPKSSFDSTLEDDIKKSSGENASPISWTSGVWHSTGTPEPSLDTGIYRSPPSPCIGWTGPPWPSEKSTPPIPGVGVAAGEEVHAAFKGSDVETSYYYKLNNIYYMLTIDNYLHEVYAYPVKDNTKDSRSRTCTNLIASGQPGYATASAFLNWGITQKRNVDSNTLPTDLYLSKLNAGSYVFP
jgi:hypothetical protein